MKRQVRLIQAARGFLIGLFMSGLTGTSHLLAQPINPATAAYWPPVFEAQSLGFRDRVPSLSQPQVLATPQRWVF